MRAPAAGLAFAFVAGVSLSSLARVSFAVSLVAAALFLAAASLSLRVRRFGPLVAALSLLLAFFLLGQSARELAEQRVKTISLIEIYRELGEGHFVTPRLVRGRLRGEPAVRSQDAQLILEAESVSLKAGASLEVDGALRVSVYGELGSRLRSLKSGERISLWASLKEPSSFLNEGGFDRGEYLARNGIVLEGSVKSALLVARLEAAPRLRGWFSRARVALVERLEDALAEAGFPGMNFERGEREEALGVLAALMIGDRSRLSPSTMRLYREAGIFHVMAISGAHVALIVWILHGALRRLGLDERPVLLVLLVLLPAYAFLCGSRPSVVRAVIMGMAVIGARLGSLDASPLNGLAMAVVALLVAEPLSLEDAGFQLSFAAMTSIVCLATRLRQEVHWLGPLATPVAVSLAAQAGVVPVLAWHFQRFTPVAIGASLLAMPLAALVMTLGALLALLAYVPLLSSLVASAVVLAVKLLTLVAEVAQSLPGSSIPVPPPGSVWLVCYLAVFVLCYFRPRLSVVGFAGLLAALLWTPDRSQTYLTVTALDVGHGDAILLELPEGQTVLIDAGGAFGDRFDAGESIILPYLLARRIRRIDRVVLTHADGDHIGGLATILSSVSVGEIWQGRSAWERPAYVRLRELARRRAIAVRTLAAGVRFRWGGVEWEILASGGEASPSDKENDHSLVTRILHGKSRLLLTGDAEAALERGLLLSGERLAADVLKVSHHGSRSSSIPSFLEAVQPGVAIVSGRRRGSAPLPSARVLHRLRRRGIDVVRTGREGAVTAVLFPDGRIEIRTYRMQQRQALAGRD